MSRDPVIHEPSAKERTDNPNYLPCDACGNLGRPKETLKRDNVVVVVCQQEPLCIGEAIATGRWKGDPR